MLDGSSEPKSGSSVLSASFLAQLNKVVFFGVQRNAATALWSGTRALFAFGASRAALGRKSGNAAQLCDDDDVVRAAQRAFVEVDNEVGFRESSAVQGCSGVSPS